MEIRPQPGPQERFLSSPADIAIYGGSAGGGKTWALLLEPLRHFLTVAEFAAVIFRRTLADAKKPGSTWDQMGRIYPLVGGRPRLDNLTWQAPIGAKIVVGHLEHETTVYDWQGAEIPLICFDELTHFSRAQFFYMLSRNRSMCGVAPYVRATCNPDADSWVAEFIAWWLDEDTGLPIPERAGKIRWFVRVEDTLHWADTAEELIAAHGADMMPKSVTFIPASIFDNKALMAADPGYLANLKALPLVEQARLLGGNWKIRPAAGLLFKRSWCRFVEAVPAGLTIVRYWDLAGTEKTQNNDPDWTVGVKLGGLKINNSWQFYLMHAERLRKSPRGVRTAISNIASSDGTGVRIGVPQDPGQAGKAQSQDIVGELVGYDCRAFIETGDKIQRFGPFSAQCEAGNVSIVSGDWNEAILSELEGFPDGKHKDDADACSGALGMLIGQQINALDYMRQLAQRQAEQKVKT